MIIAVLLLATAFGAFALLARAKHRQTWTEIFRLRREIAALHDGVIAARKESGIATIREQARLPLRMPSQNGEELLLWNYFGRKRRGFYVDVGAYDGVGFSNSYFFEAIGWSGVLVEAAPELHRAAAMARPHSRVVHAAAGNCGGTIRFTVVEGAEGWRRCHRRRRIDRASRARAAAQARSRCR